MPLLQADEVGTEGDDRGERRMGLFAAQGCLDVGGGDDERHFLIVRQDAASAAASSSTSTILRCLNIASVAARARAGFGSENRS